MKEKYSSDEDGNIWQITPLKVSHGMSISFSKLSLIKQFTRR